MRGVVYVQLRREAESKRGVPEAGVRACLQPTQVLLDDTQLGTLSRLAALITPPPGSATTTAASTANANSANASTGGGSFSVVQEGMGMGRASEGAPGASTSLSAGRRPGHRSASSQNLQSKPLLATRLIEDWVPTGPRPGARAGAGAASANAADDVAAARLAGLDAR